MPIYPQNRLCTPKIVGTFYMQGYKVKEKTAIVPHSVALYPLFQNSVGTLGLSSLDNPLLPLIILYSQITLKHMI
jgi:hypothetical protein